MVDIGTWTIAGNAYGEIYGASESLSSGIIPGIAGNLDPYSNVTFYDSGRLLIGPNSGGLYEVFFALSFTHAVPDSWRSLEASLNVNASSFKKISMITYAYNDNDSAMASNLSTSGLFRLNGNDIIGVEIATDSITMSITKYRLWIKSLNV